MKLLIGNQWNEYQLLDSGNGKRLEQFGKYIIVKPDPQCLWKPSLPKSEWDKANAVFTPSAKNNSEKGSWNTKDMPAKWLVNYKNLKFYAKLSPFKHTGIFPEQSANCDFVQKALTATSTASTPKILNLFGYTG